MEEEIDLDKVCRVCLASSGVLLKMNSVYVAETPIVDMINYIFGYLCVLDGFTKLICPQCIEEIKMIFKFKQKCQNSFDRIYKYITSKNVCVKEENIDLDETQLGINPNADVLESKSGYPEASKIVGLESVDEKNDNVESTDKSTCNLHSAKELLEELKSREVECLGRSTIGRKRRKGMEIFKCHICCKDVRSIELFRKHMEEHDENYKCEDLIKEIELENVNTPRRMLIQQKKRKGVNFVKATGTPLQPNTKQKTHKTYSCFMCDKVCKSHKHLNDHLMEKHYVAEQNKLRINIREQLRQVEREAKMKAKKKEEREEAKMKAKKQKEKEKEEEAKMKAKKRKEEEDEAKMKAKKRKEEEEAKMIANKRKEEEDEMMPNKLKVEYECYMCKMRMKTKRNLTKHMQIHTGRYVIGSLNLPANVRYQAIPSRKIHSHGRVTLITPGNPLKINPKEEDPFAGTIDQTIINPASTASEGLGAGLSSKGVKIASLAELFQCHVCDKWLSSRQSLKEHMQLIHAVVESGEVQANDTLDNEKQTPETIPIISRISSNDKDPLEGTLDKSITKSFTLQKVKGTHDLDRDYAIICHICGVRLKTQENLRQHLQSHEEQKYATMPPLYPLVPLKNTKIITGFKKLQTPNMGTNTKKNVILVLKSSTPGVILEHPKIHQKQTESRQDDPPTKDFTVVSPEIDCGNKPSGKVSGNKPASTNVDSESTIKIEPLGSNDNSKNRGDEDSNISQLSDHVMFKANGHHTARTQIEIRSDLKKVNYRRLKGLRRHDCIEVDEVVQKNVLFDQVPQSIAVCPEVDPNKEHLEAQANSNITINELYSDVNAKQADCNNSLSRTEQDEPLQTDLLCGICGRNFISARLLLRHKREVHGPLNYSSSVCNTLNKHQKLHDKRISYKCRVCANSFRRIFQLKHHMSTHSEDHSQHVCTICDKTFSHLSILKRHVESHGAPTHVCGTCGKVFGRNSNLLFHLKRYNHVEERNMKDIDLNVILYPGNVVNVEVNSDHQGMEIKHNSDNINPEMMNEPNDTQQTERNMKQHQDNVDEIKTEKINDTLLNLTQYVIKSRELEEKVEAEINNRIAPIEKQFSVKEHHICGKQYSCKSALNDHMVSHFDVPLTAYQSIQSKSVLHNVSKSAHIVQNTNQPAESSISGLTAERIAIRDKMLMLRLKRRVPPGQFPCKICGKIFKYTSNLCRHNKYLHSVDKAC